MAVEAGRWLRRKPRLVAGVRLGRRLGREWQQDRVQDLAASVAFWIALSTFPLLIALAAGLGVVDVVAGPEAATQAEDTIVDLITGVVGEGDGADLVEAVRELFRSSSTGVLTLGILGALYTGSRGVAGVVRALDVAYDLPESRSWLRTRAVGLGLAVGSVAAGIVLVAMVVLGPALGGGAVVADAIGLDDTFAYIWNNLRGPFAFVVVVAWAVVVYDVAPNHRHHWRASIPGAVFTAAGWIIVSLGFRVYLSAAATGNQVLGALGGGLVLLLWLYLLSVVLILGGELNAELEARRNPPGTPKPDE